MTSAFLNAHAASPHTTSLAEVDTCTRSTANASSAFCSRACAIAMPPRHLPRRPFCAPGAPAPNSAESAPRPLGSLASRSTCSAITPAPGVSGSGAASLKPAVKAEDLASHLPHPASSTESALIAHQQLALVWETVGLLSERQRSIFLLRFVEELDLAEIATITGLPVPTVKTHLYRALAAIRSRHLPVKDAQPR